jgi:hypothetical protein
MAETKTETKTKLEVKPVAAEREGLVTSWVSQGAELAERTTTTAFGIVRDVRGELNQRILGTLAFIEGSQQGVFKLLRGVDERIDKLAEDVLEATESLTLGIIRTLRDTGHGVTDLAGNLARPREMSRAA